MEYIIFRGLNKIALYKDKDQAIRYINGSEKGIYNLCACQTDKTGYIKVIDRETIIIKN